jgi:hypothetical protein
MYLNDNQDRFPDRRDLKASLPGGYHPWAKLASLRSARRLGGHCFAE